MSRDAQPDLLQGFPEQERSVPMMSRQSGLRLGSRGGTSAALTLNVTA